MKFNLNAGTQCGMRIPLHTSQGDHYGALEDRRRWHGKSSRGTPEHHSQAESDLLTGWYLRH